MSKHRELITRKVREARSVLLDRETYLKETISYYQGVMQQTRDPLDARGPICRFMIDRARRDLATLELDRAEINRLGQSYHEQAHRDGSANCEMEGA